MIKTTIKAKTTLKITQGDTSLFQTVLNAGSSISNSASFSVQKGLMEMNVADLEKLKHHLMEKAGKTTNKVKMYSVHTYFDIFTNLSDLQAKITTTMESFKTLVHADLDENWCSENGDIQYQAFVEKISNIIAVKGSQEMQT